LGGGLDQHRSLDAHPSWTAQHEPIVVPCQQAPAAASLEHPALEGRVPGGGGDPVASFDVDAAPARLGGERDHGPLGVDDVDGRTGLDFDDLHRVALREHGVVSADLDVGSVGELLPAFVFWGPLPSGQEPTDAVLAY